jgi:hypothetical protein
VLILGSEFVLSPVSVCLTRAFKQLNVKAALGLLESLSRAALGETHDWHTLCTLKRRAAAPAGCELRFELLTALRASPGSPRRCSGGLLERTQGRRFERVLYHQLRPGFQHRQITERAGEILISQLAVDAGCDQNIARMRDL